MDNQTITVIILSIFSIVGLGGLMFFLKYLFNGVNQSVKREEMNAGFSRLENKMDKQWDKMDELNTTLHGAEQAFIAAGGKKQGD